MACVVGKVMDATAAPINLVPADVSVTIVVGVAINGLLAGIAIIKQVIGLIQ